MHVMIADDSGFMHDVLPSRFRDLGLEVSQARSTAEIHALLARGVRPDVILLDIWFRGEGRHAGLTAARTIRRHYPEIGLIALSQLDELRLAVQMMSLGKQVGRVGYLMKDRVQDVKELVQSISAVAAGGICVDAELQGLGQAGHRLTETQGAVAELIARGFTNRGIADRLKIGEGTVEKHETAIRKIYELPSREEERKLQVNIRVLIARAYMEDLGRVD